MTSRNSTDHDSTLLLFADNFQVRQNLIKAKPFHRIMMVSLFADNFQVRQNLIKAKPFHRIMMVSLKNLQSCCARYITSIN